VSVWLPRWTNQDHARRSLLYRYSPRYMHYASELYATTQPAWCEPVASAPRKGWRTSTLSRHGVSARPRRSKLCVSRVCVYRSQGCGAVGGAAGRARATRHPATGARRRHGKAGELARCHASELPTGWCTAVRGSRGSGARRPQPYRLTQLPGDARRQRGRVKHNALDYRQGQPCRELACHYCHIPSSAHSSPHARKTEMAQVPPAGEGQADH
jgi:hypothetical protein